MAERVSSALLALRMETLRWTHWWPFARRLRDPSATQRSTLRSVLQRQRETRFGVEQRFDLIDGHREFSRRVPVQTYETLRPLIEEQERTGEPVVNARTPVMYAQTSGTTAAPKLVPVLEETLAAYRHDQALQAYRQYQAVPEAYRGKLLMIGSPAVEGRLPSGRPYGSASGQVLASLPAFARARYVLPPEVFSIGDYELKYLTILRLALAESDMTSMGSANPSTFLKLLSVLREHADSLTEDLAAQRFARIDELEPEVRAAVAPRLRCAPARAAMVREVLASNEPSYADLWPGLRLVTTWTGGSCGVALSTLAPALPESARICELGYLASEVRGTVVVDVEHNLGVPAIHETFFEFVERDCWDADRPEFLTVEALEPGREYYVIVTTGAGLYRYFMNDLVSVTGRFEATPTIQFVRKGKGVTSITGEKLYENQVLEAIAHVEREFDFACPFFVLFADTHRALYRLVIECPEALRGDVDRIGRAVERALGTVNLEYAQKRASGRLRDMEVLPVRAGTADAYKRDCVSRGQRESQFKPQVLQYHDDCHFRFDDYRLEVSA